MRLLQFHSFSAALAAVLFCAAPGVSAEGPAFAGFLGNSSEPGCSTSLPTATEGYAAALALPAAEREGQRLQVALDLAPASSPGFTLDATGALRYRMAFNNVAEGWSWQPLAQPDSEDYYRWKFFPLQSVIDERAAYVQEEKIGEPQQTRVSWRYDYFLAFDNPYDFYPRVVDDDAGFSASIPPDVEGVRLQAVVRLVAPALSESTTFWKAIYSRPVDFTLKKRYLIGRLEALLVCDAAGSRVLARIAPLSENPKR